MTKHRRRQAQVVLLGVFALALGAGGTRLLDSPDPAPRAPDTATAPAAKAPAEDAPAPPSEPRPQPRLFSSTSFWNAPVPRDATLDRGSDALMKAFNAQVRNEQEKGIGPWIATTEASTPVYTVSRAQRRTPVELRTGSWGKTLRDALAAGVPIPPDARPAAGPDRHMTIYQPSTDTLWEFWHAAKLDGRWTAEWGGVMRGVSRSPGYFTDRSSPGSGHNWGATATSLPVVGGTITIDELRRGRIDHTLALDVPNARKGQFSWPAQRSDGSGGPSTLPEGARMRLDPALDVRSLNLPPAGQALAVAAQRYGIVVRDQTHHATGFYAEDPSPTGTNPYQGSNGLFGGTPADALKGFPWDRLQLLKMSLCSAAPCARQP